jgi:intracellular sulfur oxidation DsrE/DsrF family protein
MKKTTLIFCSLMMMTLIGYSQTHNSDSTVRVLMFQKDSTLHARIHADSAQVKKDFGKKIRIAKLKSTFIYPVFNAGEGSGVIPVKGATEIPDPTLDYKLLFELEANNPDSVIQEINLGLVEIARIINLHVAAGIPLKKIFPVIVVHSGGLNVVTTNDYYKEHFKTNNPNIKLIHEMDAIGAKFIACGQAMAYFDFKKEAMLPEVKVSFTAKTVLSSYMLKGYVRY